MGIVMVTDASKNPNLSESINTIMAIAYVYKWTHIPSMRWYIGSRTNKNAHLDDGYICSSKVVKPMIEQNPNEWKREIIGTGTIEEMRELESEILQLFDAMNDSRSFNQHNNDGKFFFLGGKPMSEKHKQKIKNALIGKPLTDERRKNISEATLGRTAWNKGKKVPFVAKSESHSQAIAQSLKGKKKSDSHVEKNRLGQLQRPKVNCPHCNKLISGMGNLKQHINANHKETP